LRKINNEKHSPTAAFNTQGNCSERRDQGTKSIKNYVEEPLRFERILSELSTNFINLSPNEIDKEIEKGLKLIVEYLDLDQGALLEFSGEEEVLIVTHSFAAPGVSQPNSKTVHSIGPNYFATLRQGEVLTFARVDDAPEAWIRERTFCEETGIQAHIGLPLKVGSSILGALTFNMYRSERSWPDSLVKQLSLLSEIFGNALARKRASMQIKELLGFEGLISSLSAKFLSLSADQIDKEIEHALQLIVEFLGVDRATIYQYSENKKTHHLTHSWSREGIERARGPLGDNDYPWISKNIMRGHTFLFSSLDEIPEEAKIDKENLQRFGGTKSAIVIPLMASEKRIGLLSLSAVRNERIWPDAIVQKAWLLGQIFANAVIRKQSDLELQHAFSEIKKLKKQLENDNTYLREEIKLEHDFHEIIGQSHPLKHVLFKIDQIAPMDTTVLILGETGTGKELVARAIHDRSQEKDRPMVKVNCAALSPNLIESELFGHEKGAFTGAHATKLGRFEIANGTTLFLDEIGELPLELQAKLLRILQNGEFERVGGSRTIKVDVRIVTATNRDLEDEVRNKRFRQDLLYRLNVFPITIPPLRQRNEDIPLFVNWFVKIYSRKMGKSITNIPKNVIKELQKYHWPGNVRELENTIERAVINTMGSVLRLMDKLVISQDEDLKAGQTQSLTEVERDHIIQVLKKTNWRISGKKGAAPILGINPSTLRWRMKKLNIHRT